MEKRSTRAWDWLTAALLFLLMQVSAARLVTTNWAPYLYFAETLAALGTILGLALGASRFGRTTLLWLTVGYTLVVVPWQLSAASHLKLLQDRLLEVGNILLLSVGQFMQRQPVRASLFFVAFVALVFWLLCILAGYWTARHRSILVGVIPAGAIVLVIQIYANYQLHGSWWLGIYLLLALLLIGRVYYLNSEQVWLQRRVYVHDEAWQNILGGLFSLVAAVIFLAWIFPSTISNVQAASDAWSRATRSVRDRLSNAVTSLQGPYGRPGTNFFGTSLGLGQLAAQGDSPVFKVEVLDSPASNARYYWRARVYDNYYGGEWTSSPSSNLSFEPTSGDLQIQDLQHRSEAQLRFTLQFPTQNLIYAPSEPVWVDRPAYVQVTPLENGANDVLSWQSKRNILSGNQYEVRAQIMNPDVEQLRAAPVEYPAWIQEHYLEVPGSIRPKFQTLASRITEGMTNPYDKAAAITAYLRSNLEYSTSLPPAPEGRDPVEWVLFSYKKGFCNYYASAEVLMLRSVGVPARMAVGFAEGEYAASAYTVRRRDAHAWPEVFFPGLGWVEFEPTVSQDALVRNSSQARTDGAQPARPLARPLDDAEQPASQPGTKPNSASNVPFSQTLAARVLLVLLYLVAFAALVYLFLRYRLLVQVPVLLNKAFESTGLNTPAWIVRWLRWNHMQPEEQAFASVTWSLRWLGKAPPVHATPGERAATLKNLLPLARLHIEAVSSELETGLFTPKPADVRRARREGLLVLWHAARARLRGFLGA